MSHDGILIVVVVVFVAASNLEALIEKLEFLARRLAPDLAVRELGARTPGMRIVAKSNPEAPVALDSFLDALGARFIAVALEMSCTAVLPRVS